MKKSEFVLVKCKGCGNPFQARLKCKLKDRPDDCYYCKGCLTFKKASILQLDNIYRRLDDMEKEINRIRKFHEDRMKEIYQDN